MAAPPETCATCRWWASADGRTGQCRAHAPQPQPARAPVTQDETGYRAVWPLTLAAEGCGEWTTAPG